MVNCSSKIMLDARFSPEGCLVVYVQMNFSQSFKMFKMTSLLDTLATSLAAALRSNDVVTCSKD